MLCEICHEREAMVHTTTTFPEGEPASHLCRECFESRGPIQGVQILDGVLARCHYCGVECDFGAPGAPKSVVIPGAIYNCNECFRDMQEYIDKHAQAASSHEEFTRNLEAYMKKRVSERRSDA
jgi:protein-arginine kinase activator protein McsA